MAKYNFVYFHNEQINISKENDEAERKKKLKADYIRDV